MILLPMHIHPDDTSERANNTRYMLHSLMSKINPEGWPKTGKSGKCVGRAARLAEKLTETA